MNKFQDMVNKFNIAISSKQESPIDNLKQLRIKLIQEEVEETVEAISDGDPIETIDGLCDILYVTYGAAQVFGVSLDTSKTERLPILKRVPWSHVQECIPNLQYSASLAIKAINENKIEEIQARLQELADGCWECAASGLGIDLAPFFLEVHRTNMNKLNGPKRESDGKQLKPEGWLPPRISSMYNRVMVGNAAICEGEHLSSEKTPKKISELFKHPLGGYFCGLCGGLLVWEDTK